MLLKDLVDNLKVISILGSTELEISGIAYDSRRVKSGFVFVCIEGFKADGHNYIASAAENGAIALLVQRDMDVPEGITAIRVEDTREALAKVSAAFYGHPSRLFSLIGITGTKGKTTTSFMVKSILETAGRKVGLVGTLGSRIGGEVLVTERTTPESHDLQALFSEMLEKKVESVVMEVSSQGLELHRVSQCDYDTAVFTNISQDHIGPNEHPDFEHYLRAKAKLFTMCKKALVNLDSKYSEYIMQSAKCGILTYGIGSEADIRAVDIAEHPGGVDFYAVTPWFEGKIRVNIPGRFSVYNALAAIGVCGIAGIGHDAVKKGLEAISVPGRAEIVETGRDFTVMIDYAHTPDSLENILSAVKAYVPGRLICVFGCGGDRDRAKRPVMGEVSGRIADYTVITSDNPRTEEPEAILREIEEGIKGTGAEYATISDRRSAIKYSIQNAAQGDIIVLAGKGHETYQIFKDKTIHFDEREVVAEILGESDSGSLRMSI